MLRSVTFAPTAAFASALPGIADCVNCTILRPKIQDVPIKQLLPCHDWPSLVVSHKQQSLDIESNALPCLFGVRVLHVRSVQMWPSPIFETLSTSMCKSCGAPGRMLLVNVPYLTDLKCEKRVGKLNFPVN